MENMHVHPDLLKRMNDLRRQDAVARADRWRLTRLATSSQQDWFSRQGCWLLCRLGRTMVQLGRRLEARGAAHWAEVTDNRRLQPTLRS